MADHPTSAPDSAAAVRTVLLAGGRGERMGRLGAGRLKPLVPYGGACRLVDFSLANARDSGLAEVLLLSQYEERQLMDDLHTVWNGVAPGFRVHFGPYDAAYRAAGAGLPEELPERTWPLERGTADALIRKADQIFGPRTAHVMVLHSDHVYRFDYRPLIRGHIERRAALTIAYQRIDPRYAHLFGVIGLDRDERLTSFVEKPEHPASDLVFAAFCVFDATVLRRYLDALDGTDWQHDISRDVIPAMLAGGERILGHRVEGHWEDIGTVERYHRAHLAMTRPDATLPVTALPRTLAPGVSRGLVDRAPGVLRSMVPLGLANRGLVEESVVFPGARIGTDARVRRSVVLPGAVVPDGADIDSAVVLEDGFVQHVEPMPSAAR
ncbi:sugar phosphate nucleotidyltransferase [Streptomyces hydrogenans]|uniref:sugar phosphate nucleotidyltransferase n=1 Tax=Streptomyces TaxID=1883 RepID=UPI00202EE406|nr:sugar phosphate nucleotidyltransferase [Streptomyces sp. G2]MCM1949562.1 sugar phosphate nucleotidyltransferase [Streptomyces sp. G2]